MPKFVIHRLVFILYYGIIATFQQIELEGPLGISNAVIGEQEDNELTPFLAVIVNKYGTHCGGAIITKSFVVTSASFFEYLKIDEVTVMSGTRNGYTSEHKHVVEKFYDMKQYYKKNDLPYANNLAVLKVKPVFNFTNPNVKPIELGGNVVGTNELVAFIGWGPYQMKTPTEQDKLRVLLQVTSYTDWCIKKRREDLRLGSHIICAYRPPLNTTCTNREGSPLFRRYQNKTELIGILSVAANSCGVGEPDVYTRISDFMTYLKKFRN